MGIKLVAAPDSSLRMTVSDMVIRELARAEAEALALLAVAEADCRSYRELAQQAIHVVARLTQERDQARATVSTLREELRRYAAAQIGRAA